MATKEKPSQPPLSPENNEKLDRLQKVRKKASQPLIFVGISVAFVEILALIYVWYSFHWVGWLFFLLILIGILLLILLIQAGYTAQWTGFSGKTLWNWIKLFIQAVAIPLSIIVGVAQFNAQQAANQQQALDQQRQATLTGYFDDMSSLLLMDGLGATNATNEVRALAEARTLTAVRNLDGPRKGTLVRFLWEAMLITGPHPIISLSGANLTDAELGFDSSSGISLSGSESAPTCNRKKIPPRMIMINLRMVDLSGAILSFANLSEADLSSADLSGANLSFVNLSEADLSSADLSRANLSGANFAGANLCNATVTAVQLAQTSSLKGAIMRDGSIHP